MTRISLISLVLGTTLTTACTIPDNGDKGGNVEQAITLTDSNVGQYVNFSGPTSFGSVEVGTTSSLTVTVSLDASVEGPVTFAVGTTDSGVFTASPAELTLVPGYGQSLVVTFAPGAEGSYADVVSLTGSDVSTSFGVSGLGFIPEELGAVDNDGDGYTEETGDCHDGDAGIYSGATEACDDVDNDCDGQIDEGCESTPPADADGDGYTAEAGDCDDRSAAINPGAEDICDNGVDEDCDGADDACEEPDTGDSGGGDTGDTGPADADGDGYDDTVDCDDTDATVNPGATEVCGDGIDQDCDGSDSSCPSTDLDGDGYDAEADGGTDCDDTDPNVNPGATEVCGDGLDNDCDGSADNTPGLSFQFSAPSDGPQPISGVTVYGYPDTGTWSCSGSGGPINLSICWDGDASSAPFGDAAVADAAKATLVAEVDAWVASAPLVDSDGVSYYAVEWVDAYDGTDPTRVEDNSICIFQGVQIAP